MKAQYTLFISALLSCTTHAQIESSLGHIYALALNSTTDTAQLVDVDLTTWDMTVSPLPGGAPIHLVGQAASYYEGMFWTSYIYGAFDSGSRLVVGFNVTTHAVTYTLNASSWPAPATLHVVVDVFAGPTGLLVTARAVGSPDLLFYTVPDPSGNGTATFLGSLPCPYCGSATYDPLGQLLYVLVDSQGQSDDPGGELWAISTECGFFVVANLTLPASFAFPQWDPASRSVVGLSLVQTPGGGGYTRNVTLLHEPSSGVYNATDHGAVPGGFFVDLSSGPSAFDPATGRAFYMLATGPLASFDVVTVAVRENPVTVSEAPPICGFIAYCPDVFTYGSGP